MGELQQSGQFRLGEAVQARMRQDFTAASASEAEVADTIRRVRKESGYLLDPHTACGVVAAGKTLPKGAVPRVVLATAHPAKFPDAVEAIVGERPGLPPRLGQLLTDKERISPLPNDLAAVKRFVSERAGAKRG